MSPLLIHIVKANIALSLFYLVYHFGLRKLTFYTLNRYFLLFGIFFSSSIPFADLTSFIQHREKLTGSAHPYTLEWYSLQQNLVQQNSFSIWEVLQYLFWAGVALMAVRFILQFLSLLRLILEAKTEILLGEKVKTIGRSISPFSFLNTIYINPSLHEKEELQTILTHEKIHIRGGHSVDILTGELHNIFYWFNPAAWLIKKAIKENLEFIADRELLKSGTDAKNYQYLLLKTAGLSQKGGPTNHFNFSHLKNRILMMNQKRSSKLQLLRYFLLLPLIAITGLIFTSLKEAPLNNDGDRQIKIQTGVSPLNQQEKKDTLSPLQRHLPKDYRAFLERNKEVDMLFYSQAKNGKASVVHVHLKNGDLQTYHLNHPEEMKRAEKKYGKFPTPPPPPPSIKNIYTAEPKVLLNADSIEFGFSSKDSLPLTKPALYIIDGHLAEVSDLSGLSPESIQSIAVLKGDKIIQKYGRKGKNGVIMIYTKSSKKSLPKTDQD